MNILNINKENILIKRFVTLSPHKVKLSDLTKVCQTAVLTECDRYTGKYQRSLTCRKTM